MKGREADGGYRRERERGREGRREEVPGGGLEMEEGGGRDGVREQRGNDESGLCVNIVYMYMYMYVHMWLPL